MQFAIANEQNLSVLVGANTLANDTSARELNIDELNWVGGGQGGSGIK
jgi:hypothetical protein